MKKMFVVLACLFLAVSLIPAVEVSAGEVGNGVVCVHGDPPPPPPPYDREPEGCPKGR